MEREPFAKIQYEYRIVRRRCPYPKATARLARVYVVASVMEHSPSDRKMIMGALYETQSSVRRHKFELPLSTPATLHDGLSQINCLGIVCPTSGLMFQYLLEELFWTACHIILYNNLTEQSKGRGSE